MQVYESRFLKVNYFEEHSMSEMIWLPETSEMSEEEYKEVFLDFLDIILKYKPTKNLPNIKEMKFGITLTLQEWTNQYIFAPVLEVGLLHSAFVVSEDFITLLSVEQVMEEPEGIKFNNRYFNNREDAWNWLVSIK